MNRDVSWYIGFIAGAAACGLILKYGGVEVGGILRLIIIIGVGIGCGWLTETMVKKSG